ncbi:MAG TPA: glycosyltransferase, partial [Patescibacteria group bacterium]|nr:glycosyltransferase [Patescibacteria group bacterium]
MKIIAVVPAYNEEKTIFKVVSELKENVKEVIAVDDGSNDQTAELAKKAGAKILTHFLNRGQGAALQTGIFCALKD